MIHDSTDQILSSETCPDCGSANVRERVVEQKFQYGRSEDQVTLSATLPVFECQECGYQYFDERGEAARHDAVCRHLGVHTPEEIRKMREISGLTRAELCELAGFGSASLQRWESGAGIPNVSNDRLLFLLSFAENVHRLKRIVSTVETQGVESTIVASAQPVPAEAVPVVQTRCGIKRFHRLSSRARISDQCVNWNLRGMDNVRSHVLLV